MATLLGANFFVYFTATNDADRVRCKLCNKSLIGKRRFNLKQHLKYAHRIEVRLDKKKVQHAKVNAKNPKKFSATPQEIASTSTGICEYSEDKNAENKDNFYDINTQAMESNDSFARTSTVPKSPPPLIIIKPECLQEVTVKHSISTEEPGATYDYEEENIEDDNDETFAQNPSHETFQSDDIFVEPSARSKRNKRCYILDPLNESDDLLTSRDNYDPRPKKKRKLFRDVPLDESTSSSNDNFEQWARKKKHLLEIEYLEMRNYKFKLELYEKEQDLHLASSKFTRDIRSNR